jgi:hypothetical protein
VHLPADRIRLAACAPADVNATGHFTNVEPQRVHFDRLKHELGEDTFKVTTALQATEADLEIATSMCASLAGSIPPMPPSRRKTFLFCCCNLQVLWDRMTASTAWVMAAALPSLRENATRLKLPAR